MRKIILLGSILSVALSLSAPMAMAQPYGPPPPPGYYHHYHHWHHHHHFWRHHHRYYR